MLSKEQIFELEEICEKWMIRKDKIETFPDLNTLYFYLKMLDFTPIIKAFTTRLEKVPCKFSRSEQVSGSVCFFGGVITSILNYGYIEEIEGLFTFALCYMLIDHFLDDNTISMEEKTKSMREIYLFIKQGKRSENRLIDAAAERYLELIEKTNCQKYIFLLFESELKGIKIQRQDNLDRETYLKIAEEKGGYTSACIGSIIGLTYLDPGGENFILGSLIQYIDDTLDMGDDERLGIMTLARHDLINSNLDQYIYRTMKIIYELSPVYNFFKVILLYGIVLGVHDNPGCISENLNNLLEKYDTFSIKTSKDSLTNWFHDKLYSYIEEKNI